jgi:Uma2 family endonuclease
MATVPRQRRTREVEYPSGDGKPMAETEVHLHVMIDTIQVLEDYFAGQPNVYVCGNLLLYYEEGNPRKHVAPNVLVAFDVPKKPAREYYLVWKEGKAPDFVVEITSKSTKQEDRKKKFGIYRDILRVSEYFLFDPTEDYLNPSLQGFRRVGGEYASIEPIAGRLPSQLLGLHLERDGEKLRLFDPATGQRLLTRLEGLEAAERRAEASRHRAEEERRRAEEERRRAEDERRRAEIAQAAQQRLADENERLRREIEALRRG